MSLARNAIFNFAGGVLPAVAALLTVPVIVSHLGPAHYGVLVLVLSIVGYFSILDINVASGSVKYIAEYHAQGDQLRVGQVMVFGVALYLVIGAAGGTLLAVFASPLAGGVFNVPPDMRVEAVLALRWAGLAFLCGQLQFFLQCVLHALQRYDLSGKSESVFGSAVSLVTVAAVLAGGGLVEIIVARLVVNLVNIAWLTTILRRLLPDMQFARPARGLVRALVSFSAYSYLSRLATVSAVNADKLFVGALADMRSLAMYSVPFTLVSRVYGMVYRLSQVMFPTASALAAQGRHGELRSAYLGATRVVVYLNASLCLLLVALAPELLHYWAGSVFGQEAVFVMVCVAGAIFIDSLTNLPSLLNDGLGQPRNTGVAALARALIGLVASYFAVRAAGIAGAAVALLVVATSVTVAFLWYLHRKVLPVGLLDVWRAAYLPSLLPVVLAIVGAVLATQRAVLPLHWAGLLGLGAVLALGLYGWQIVLTATQRVRLLGLTRARLLPP